jgi:hypothetical protein
MKGFRKDEGLHASTHFCFWVNTFRDAVRFHNGVEPLLQRLDEGQRVRVLELSSGEEQETALNGQQSVMGYSSQSRM